MMQKFNVAGAESVVGQKPKMKKRGQIFRKTKLTKEKFIHKSAKVKIQPVYLPIQKSWTNKYINRNLDEIFVIE